MRKHLFRGLLAGALSLCLAIVSLFAVSLLEVKAENTDYRYLLAFQDNFDGTVSDGWSLIAGGSSYTYEKADGSTAYGWNFGGWENRIAYKTKTATDYGKFLYGDENSTNYTFEVKVRADVNETLGEYMSANSANLGAALTLNTHIPFFVTNPSPDANKHTFKGRSVCVSNYAIGFYEYGDTSGWAKSARLNTKFSEDFDWREWHTIRVEATETECNLWLDGVLILTAAQSEFTRATTASGLCGFAGICNAAYVPLYYDDFRVWTENETYDPMIEKEVSGIDAADFRDTTKIDYQSGSIATGLLETEKNALIYNPDAKFGTDIRLLKEYTYQSFEITAAFDIENQKTAKGVVEGELFTNSQVRTGIAGILFNGSGNSTGTNKVSYNGYLLKYHAVYCTSGTALTNTVTLQLYKYTNTATTSDPVAQIGILSGTTSCIINAKVENGVLSVSVYKTAADLESGNKATLASPSTTVTVADGVYSIKLPDYDASAGGDYTEGQIGFWCNSGGTATGYVYEAEILSFRGKTLVESEAPAYQPVAEETEHTVTVIATNGSATVNGAESTGETVVSAHTDVTLSFAPAEGYYLDDVTIDGVSVGGVETFVIGNITKDYEVEAVFKRITANYTVKHYIEAAVYTGESDRYVLTEETLTGNVGDETAATAKTQAGVTAREFLQETIAEGGDTVVEIYYDREGAIQANIGGETFYSIGASVRLKKGDDDTTGSGIRFGFVLEKSVYDRIESAVSFGALIIPADLAGEELTTGTSLVRNVNTDGTWFETTIDGVSYMQSVVYLYDIPESSYARGIAARGYIETSADGEKQYDYYTGTVVRSLSSVAQSAYNDESFTEKDSVAVYLPVLSFDGNGAEGEMQAVTMTDSLDYILPACTFAAPEGKVFGGWEIDGKIYAAGGTFTFDGSARITATAVWTDAA